MKITLYNNLFVLVGLAVTDAVCPFANNNQAQPPKPTCPFANPQANKPFPYASQQGGQSMQPFPMQNRQPSGPMPWEQPLNPYSNLAPYEQQDRRRNPWKRGQRPRRNRRPRMNRFGRQRLNDFRNPLSKTLSGIGRGLDKGMDLMGNTMDRGLDRMGNAMNRGMDRMGQGVDRLSNFMGQGMDRVGNAFNGMIPRGNYGSDDYRPYEEFYDQRN